jgi:hypothetical protein
MNRATRRKLVHDPSLFFDILGEGKHCFHPMFMRFAAAAASCVRSSSAPAGPQPHAAANLSRSQAIAGCGMRR